MKPRLRCVGIMVRFSVFLFCSMLVQGAAWAFPQTKIVDLPSLAIRIDEDSFPPTYPSSDSVNQQDCRHPGALYNSPECVDYRRMLAILSAVRAKEQAAAALKAKPVQKPVTSSKQDAKKTASRALSNHERSIAAPKPLAPLVALPASKPAPGNTASERLRHMVGQLLLTGFAGREPEDPDVGRVAREVSEGRLSGVIVRDSNVENFLQLRQLLAGVTNYGSEMPALIAIDQPGGPDTVLSEEKGFTFFGAANSVSSSNSPRDAQLLYRAMGDELAALGVTLNIGPSEDVCREDGVNLSALCFGVTPPQIAAYARAFNFGHHDRGVLTAMRHVPFRQGLRTASRNEPASSAMLRLIVKAETSDALLVPVKAREPLLFTDLGSAFPSRKIRSRDERGLGFHGAVIFEVEMSPGKAPIRYDEIVVRAFQAGADMILVREPENWPPDLYSLSLAAIQAGIKSGRLPQARIEEAYRHVKLLKDRLRMAKPRTLIAGLNRVGPH